MKQLIIFSALALLTSVASASAIQPCNGSQHTQGTSFMEQADAYEKCVTNNFAELAKKYGGSSELNICVGIHDVSNAYRNCTNSNFSILAAKADVAPQRCDGIGPDTRGFERCVNRNFERLQ